MCAFQAGIEALPVQPRTASFCARHGLCTLSAFPVSLECQHTTTSLSSPRIYILYAAQGQGHQLRDHHRRSSDLQLCFGISRDTAAAIVSNNIFGSKLEINDTLTIRISITTFELALLGCTRLLPEIVRTRLRRRLCNSDLADTVCKARTTRLLGCRPRTTT